MKQNMEQKQEEIWRKVEEFDDYDVSNFGRIRKYTQPKYGSSYFRYPSFSVSSNGSLKLSFVGEGGKVHGRQLAKIVYETFMGKETSEDIIFADGDKTNCSLDNLWTPEELVEIAKKYNALTREIKY